MKNILITSVLMLGIGINAQVTIEKAAPSTPANDFVSIEFGNSSGGAKGIILPWVTSESVFLNPDPLNPNQKPVPGTFIFDVATQKVKLAIADTAGATQANSFFDFSGYAARPSNSSTNNGSLIEASNAKVIVGASTSSAPGILVLETPDPANKPKAMILPRVNQYTDIVNPAAGMMVYITSTDTFAVYNGQQWSFWQGN